ncbi:MAG: efflux RND transporter periplasmic adaptor subunit [Rhodoferax sp.]|nr:efflux RND transporter periplasmic adaptor subunit [Rhodoferax sp.]
MSAKKILFPVLVVLGVVAALALAWWAQKPGTSLAGAAPSGAPAAAGPGVAARAPLVEAARVEVMPLSDETQAVGTLRSRQGVMLRPEVSGRVAQLNFRDGERVRKGQLLLQLDDQLPQAQIKQSQAELSIAVANHQRNQELVAQKFVSQRSVEESAAALEVAQAKLALAQVTAARLKLLAPFDGVAGIRNVSVGDYLKDGADVVNIEDMELMFVDFRLPERFQGKVKKGQVAMLDLDAVPGRRFSAVVQAIDPQIDANGRSVLVRACLDNRHLQLRPGMFARVNAVFGEREQARVIPEEALVPQGNRQFVIRLKPGVDKETMVAQRVDVKLGIRKPGRVEILEGLEAGDLVVIAGQQRVQKDGMAVRLAEFGAAPAGAAPVPAMVPTRPASAARASTPPTAAAAGPNPCLQAR